MDATTRKTAERSRQIILLVEDHEADRDVYGSLLWYNGYEVVHAADGRQALEKAAAVRPDLILLDLKLPEVGGVEVARRVREQGLTTPIIVLSARPKDEVPEVMAIEGVVAYLEKPIDPFVVVREVQRRVGFAQAGEGNGP